MSQYINLNLSSLGKKGVVRADNFEYTNMPMWMPAHTHVCTGHSNLAHATGQRVFVLVWWPRVAYP